MEAGITCRAGKFTAGGGLSTGGGLSCAGSLWGSAEYDFWRALGTLSIRMTVGVVLLWRGGLRVGRRLSWEWYIAALIGREKVEICLISN